MELSIVCLENMKKMVSDINILLHLSMLTFQIVKNIHEQNDDLRVRHLYVCGISYFVEK